MDGNGDGHGGDVWVPSIYMCNGRTDAWVGWWDGHVSEDGHPGRYPGESANEGEYTGE